MNVWIISSYWGTLCDKQSPIPLLRTFITGRPETDIKEKVKGVNGVHTASFLELEGNNQDVEINIWSRIKNNDIQDRVIRRAEGLFIWARVACDMLDQALDIDGQLEELEGTSNTGSKLD